MTLHSFDSDTIVAISTSPGEGGVGMIRVSGPQAFVIADQIFRSKKNLSVTKQKTFTAQYGHIVEGKEGSAPRLIDEVLLFVMRAPKSYTCEDVVEISAHGGLAVLKAILDLCVKAGARMAEKGEFTKRAFLNGRIDLLQAEAVLDLVTAKSEVARAHATAQLEGELSKKVREIKDDLVNVLTHLEASIDFPDDFPDTASFMALAKKLSADEEVIKKLLAGAWLGFIAKNGLKVVLAGRPNVGKSSLLNALVKSSRAIVTPFPGTTRDVVEEEVSIRGHLLRIQDTAGIQVTENPIEKEGIERSKKAVASADLVLYVLDGSDGLLPEDAVLLSTLGAKERRILVLNKMDLPQKQSTSEIQKKISGENLSQTSCITENGTAELEEKIFRYINQGVVQVSGEPLINSARQKHALETALEAVDRAKKACEKELSPELIAVDLRLALDELGGLIGEVATDDVLEVLFSRFCIGK